MYQILYIPSDFQRFLSISKVFLVFVLKLSQPKILTHRTFPKKTFLETFQNFCELFLAKSYSNFSQNLS